MRLVIAAAPENKGNINEEAFVRPRWRCCARSRRLRRQGRRRLGENVEENYEDAADNLEATADNTANAAEAAALENQADALEGRR